MATQTAYIFLTDRPINKVDTSQLQSNEEQLELFLLKHTDCDRDNLNYIVENLFDPGEKLSHVLDESELIQVMDDLGLLNGDNQRISAFLRQIPSGQQGKATFTQLACMIYNKQYQDIYDFKDPEAEAKTQAAAAKAKAVEEQILKEKEAERKTEEDKEKMKEKIQSGLQKSGVAGKAAFFEKSIQDKSKDNNSTIEKIRHDAALKRQQKEAEKALEKAREEEAARAKAIEDQAAEVKKNVKMAKLAEQMAQFGINTSK